MQATQKQEIKQSKGEAQVQVQAQVQSQVQSEIQAHVQAQDTAGYTYSPGSTPTRGEAGSPTSAAVDSVDAAAPATTTRASLLCAIPVQFSQSSSYFFY